jgi:hypothetical protein
LWWDPDPLGRILRFAVDAFGNRPSDLARLSILSPRLSCGTAMMLGWNESAGAVPFPVPAILHVIMKSVFRLAARRTSLPG